MLMKISPVLILQFILLSDLTGQVPIGTWSDHLSYSSVRAVEIGSENIYASTGSSILIYNKIYSEAKKLSRVNGLSSTGISCIEWSVENNTLLVAYNSTGIDLISGNSIVYIPDIQKKYIPGKKKIYNVRSEGRYAFLACSFGIVVVDLIKKEIADTWRPVSEDGITDIYDVATGNGNIYASTGQGIYSASLSGQGLSYSGNWRLLPGLPDPSGRYSCLLYTPGGLITLLSNVISGGDAVYSLKNSTSHLITYEQGVSYSSIDPYSDGFILSGNHKLEFYNSEGSLEKVISSYPFGAPSFSQAVTDGRDTWIADLNYGLIYCRNMSTFSPVSVPGPLSNLAYNITSLNGKTVITAGGITSSGNSSGNPFMTSVNEIGNWSSLQAGGIKDPVRSIIDPEDNGHVFISAWGKGLLEFDKNNLLREYVSPLQAGNPGSAIFVYGLAFDQDRNLWITQSNSSSSIKVLKPDGSWLTGFARINANLIGDIIIDHNGYKWVTLPGGNGLYVLDDNRTISNTTDDRQLQFQVKDNENRIISNVYSIVCDLEGTIWIGTDQGPVLYYPDQIFNDANVTGFRVKIARNDGSGQADFLLNSESVTAIAVDGGNRKWIGTSRSGIYHLSSDGTKELAHFTTSNSPLFSDSISSLSVDNKTGELWIGTSEGVLSYTGNAIEGNEKFAKVYAFPNPVREDYTGSVTITGLMRDTEVKITDLSGDLVYETRSEGGMATWNLNNYRGRRVATGVYFAFCSGPEGKHATVTKILVIR